MLLHQAKVDVNCAVTVDRLVNGFFLFSWKLYDR